jgi:hypothetical protein
LRRMMPSDISADAPSRLSLAALSCKQEGQAGTRGRSSRRMCTAC